MDAQSHIASIKSKIKADVNESRMNDRAFRFNSHRKNYDNVSAQIKLPSLESFASLCRSFVQKKKLIILQKIRYGLSGSGRYISSFLEVGGSLYALVGCFTGPKTNLQNEAGYAIINLGLGSQEECLKVCNKVGAYLVANLKSASPHMQMICAWAFGNLMGSHEKVCSLAQSQGFEGAIKSLLSSTNQEVFQTCIYAINQYFSIAPHRIESIVDDYFIKSLIKSCINNEEESCDIYWCLFLISTKEKCCSSLVNLGVIDNSISFLNYLFKNQIHDISSQTALLRVIINCTGFVKESALTVVRHSLWLPVMKILLDSPHESVKKEALQLVANVYNSEFLTCEEGDSVKRFLEDPVQKCLVSHFA